MRQTSDKVNIYIPFGVSFFQGDILEIKELISEEKIRERIKTLSAEIKKDFCGDDNNIFCVVVLTGAFVFFADLMRGLNSAGMNVEYAPVKVTSYKGTESTGVIRVDLDVKEDLKGKHVLIVDDIIDSGNTLNFLKAHLLKKGASEVRICVLLDKKERRKSPVDLDYIGFDIPNMFVVGYGLDYNGKDRDLSFIGYIEK